jgi:ubiquinone/menaquinone biosynthesis C-methylase UbiE
MNKKADDTKIIEVFTDVRAHRLMADLIRKHSANRDDVREIALDRLNLKTCRNILDLGCGFGFFTEALKGKVHPGAVVTGLDLIGGYEAAFLETCRKAELEGRFLSAGAPLIKKITDNTFDLILCSYALYFFPDAIPEISRILTSDGSFIVITHDRNNMREMIAVTKDILSRKNILQEKSLPLEKIISQFSSENGMEMLKPWFGHVSAVDYCNSLVFRPEDSSQIVEYFLFKSPFLLSGTNVEMEWVARLLSVQFQQASFMRDGFTISKNDRIFVCSSPLHGQAGYE